MSLFPIKKSVMAVFLSLFFLPIIVFSQTPKEVLSNYRKALGKMSDDKNFQSMALEGSFFMQKMELPARMFFKAPDKMRIEMRFQNFVFLQISSDTLEWSYNAVEDKSEIKRRERSLGFGNGNQSSNGFDYSSAHLLRFDEAKDRMTVSKAKLDSFDVLVVEVFKQKDQKSSAKIYLNKKTYLIHKIEDERGSRYFANYYQKDGYVFPRFVENREPEQTVMCKFTRLAFNEKVADSLFVIPKHVIEESERNKQQLNKDTETCDAFYNKGEFDKAFACYDKLIAKNKESYFGYNGRGLVKIERGEYYEAIADLSKALEIDPSGSAARSNRGLAKYYLEDYEGAIKDYSKALEYDPNYTTAIKNRGMAHIALEKYEEAANDFASSIKINGEEGDAYLWHGFSLAQLKKYDEALSAYRLAFAAGERSGDFFNYKGVAEYQLEQYDSSKVSFLKAMKLDPENFQFIENYARSLYNLDDYEKAMEYFQTCINNNHELADMYNMLGLCKFNQENYKGAIKDFSKSIEADGTNPTIFDNRASAKEHIEDYVGAIQDYSESIRLYPTDAEVFYKRGLLKIKSSNKIEGCLDLSTAHDMKYEPAKDAIYKNCN